MLERAWFAHGIGVPATIVVRAQPGPYFALDALGAIIVHLLGAAVGLRVIAAITVAAIPIGFALLLNAVGGEARRWAVVGVPFGFGFFTQAGFLSYVVGVGVAFAFLAAWWPRRRSPTMLGVILLVVGIALCYLTHLASALIVLVVIWVDAIVSRDRRIWVVLGLTASVGAMYLWTTIGAPPLPPGKPAPLTFGTLGGKPRISLRRFMCTRRCRPSR